MVIRRATLVVASAVVLGSGSGAQRDVLPFGLKAGRHTVRTESAGNRTLWAPQDSGSFPGVVIVTDRPTRALDAALPRYLASHGFRVAQVGDEGVDAAIQAFGDRSPVAVVQWAHDTAAAAILDGTPPLSIRVVRPGVASSGRLRIVLPPLSARPEAAARRYRLVCAVTQAILNATVTGARPNMQELAARLRAAGLQGTYIRAS